jgi:DNA polymerase III alpha subunit
VRDFTAEPHTAIVGPATGMIRNLVDRRAGPAQDALLAIARTAGVPLVLEDFHGTAEAIVFPEAWAKLNQTIAPDGALLLSGGYSDRDRGEERAPFIVEGARPLAELKESGAVALSLRWALPSAPPADTLRAAAALCTTHPGPTPLYIEWSDGNGEAVRLRSRRLRVAADDDLVRALRDLLGTDSVHYVKAN